MKTVQFKSVMFEDRTLGIIFGPKMEQARAG